MRAPGKSILVVSVILLVFIFNIQTVRSQNVTAGGEDTKLYQAIAHMDSVVFNAFNTHNLEVLKSVFATNVEFYHDKGGLSDYNSTISSFKKLFEVNPGLRRELVQGTLEVYPVPGYGAVEIGIHRFVHTENGKEVVGTFKFIHIWQFKDNQWKATRVISVGH